MTDVGYFNARRVFGEGLLVILAGSIVIGVVAALVGYAVLVSYEYVSGTSVTPSDALILFSNVVFGLLLIYPIFQGLSYIRSSFDRNCYLRAGAEGIAIRMPDKYRPWSYRLEEQVINWDEVSDIEWFDSEYFGARQLMIHLRRERGGILRPLPMRALPAYLFTETLDVIRDRLLAIRADAIPSQ